MAADGGNEELFGPGLRYSGFAFAGALGSIISGGPAPFISALLVGMMAGAHWGVACYVIFALVDHRTCGVVGP